MDDAIIARRRVDATGAITGLDAARDREVFVVRLPDLDEVQRKAEDEAERMARDLDLDPVKARNLVHDAAEAARKGAERMAATWDRLTAGDAVARESAEEKEALSDVAVAARRGGADWTPSGEGAGSGRHGPSRDLPGLP